MKLRPHVGLILVMAASDDGRIFVHDPESTEYGWVIINDVSGELNSQALMVRQNPSYLSSEHTKKVLFLGLGQKEIQRYPLDILSSSESE